MTADSAELRPRNEPPDERGAPAPHTAHTVTRLLSAARAGDGASVELLLPLVYDELHRLAAQQMRGEGVGHTLQPTALVHEAFLRLAGAPLDVADRAHFFALAATTMRRVLVDHAKARRRGKRGGGAPALPLEEALHVAASPGDDVLALDESLERLAGRDARKARVVELHYFGGLNYDEIAATLGISAATVDRDLRFAQAWLFADLGGEGGGRRA
jgi:RNA polymerase sigma factor (TIGR02999 family)